MKSIYGEMIATAFLLFTLYSSTAFCQDETDDMVEEDVYIDTTRIMMDSLYYSAGISIDVGFEKGKPSFTDPGNYVQRIADIMNVNPALELIIECGGRLADKRAELVKDAVVARGISVERLNAKGDDQSANDLVVLKIKSLPGLEKESGALSNECFGIELYPGAVLDEQQTNFARNIMGGDMFCYTSRADLKKVVAFYEKLEGLTSLGGDEHSAVFIKNEDGQMARIAISNSWFDPKTGEQRFDTLIQLIRE
jgi:hypothetical protein